MTSSINPFNIDGTYPVAGQDNDSQGFRDNFTNIRNNFSYAANEISDLQSKALLKSALTGGTLNNSLGGAVLSQAQLQSISSTLLDQGTVSGVVTLDFSQSNLYRATTSGSITLAFANFPTAGIAGTVSLILVVTNPSYTLTVPVTSPGVTLGLSEIAGANAATGVITFDAAGTYQLQFLSVDGGQNILVEDLTRNYTTFRGTNVYYNPAIDSAMYVGFGSGNLTTAKTIAPGLTTISALGEHNAISVGNLRQANLTYHTIDTGRLAGYTVTSARGNLQLGNLTPVSGGDLLGYVNAKALTGNGAGNVFQQISTIGFYATGSNVAYGLGGNVAIFTADDGGSGPSYVKQAVGFENDQSTKFYGNVILANGAPVHSNSIGTTGQVAFDSTYFYVCVSANTWQRVQLNITSW